MTPIENNLISPHEVEAGELLWKYIAELHNANGAEQVNFIARTSLDPTEVAALIPLADTLHAEFQQQADTVHGEILARARLLAAIQSGARPAPPWWLQVLSTHGRDIVALIGLLLGLGGAIWFVYTQTSPPPYVKPAYDYNSASHPDGCAAPPKNVTPKNGANTNVRLHSK